MTPIQADRVLGCRAGYAHLHSRHVRSVGRRLLLILLQVCAWFPAVNIGHTHVLIYRGPDTGGAKKIVPSKQWKMQMYLSAQPLYNMPLDLTGLQLLGKEVKV